MNGEPGMTFGGSGPVEKARKTRRSRWPVAGPVLLNLTGTGAGWLLLRQWRRWLIGMGGLALLLFVALRTNAAPLPAFWIVVLGLWVLLMAADAARVAWRFPPSGQIARVALVVAIAVLGLEAAGFAQYRARARDHLVAAESAFRSADCSQAHRSFDRMLQVFPLSLTFDVGAAKKSRHLCAQALAADSDRRAGRFASADARYRNFFESDPGSLEPFVRPPAANLYLEWGDNLIGSGHFDDALTKYQYVLTTFGDLEPQASKAKIGLGDTYLRWGDSLIGSGRFEDAANKYRNVLTTFGDLEPQASKAKIGLGDTYLRWGARLRENHDDFTAIRMYLVVRREWADTPAGPGASQALAEMTAAAVSLAASKPCDALPTLEPLAAAGDPSTEGAAASMPGVLYACGQQRHSEGKYAEAVSLFRSIPPRFPGTQVAAAAESALITTEVAMAKGGATGSLPPPAAAGSAPRGSVTVVVHNASRERIEILASGPTPKRIAIEPCSDCASPSFASNSCQGPEVQFTLGPGTYDVIAKALSSTNVTPFSGSWSLSSGTRYESCFYITTRFR